MLRLDASATDWIVSGDDGSEITRVTADSKTGAEQLARLDPQIATRRRTFTVSNARTLHAETVAPGQYAGLVGTDSWEMLELQLVELHTRNSWPEARYRLELSTADGTVVETVERELPEPPAYAKLTYKPRVRGSDAPIRARIVNLVNAYPGSTIRQVAEHYETFAKHFAAKLSTPELTNVTGYTLPAGAPRPLSPYCADYAPDEIPSSFL